MKLTDKVSIPAQVMARDVGGETVILNLESGIYFGLDSVGARIWELLAAGATPADACTGMMAEYDVSREDIERDVLALLEELRAHQLIAIA